jgi:hypothetical protein
MKNNPLPALLATLLALAAFTRLCGDSLAASATVHVKPDVAAPVITTLAAGAEPFMAVGVAAPAGWLAVALPGTHEVFLRNSDQLKDMSPKPGANYLLSNRPPATPVAIAEKGDFVELVDIVGSFTKYRLSKPLIGFIQTAALNKVTPPTAAVVTAPPPAAPVVVTATVLSVEPAVVASTPTTSPRDLAAPPAGELPRLFQGTLVSTYSPLRPRRPYDYQLNDRNGERYAYLDLSRLPPSVTPDNLAGHTVVVYGVARAVAGVPEMVIAAESIQTP